MVSIGRRSSNGPSEVRDKEAHASLPIVVTQTAADIPQWTLHECDDGEVAIRRQSCVTIMLQRAGSVAPERAKVFGACRPAVRTRVAH